MHATFTHSSVTAEAAHAAVAAAVAHAGSLGIRVNAAVTDEAGVLMAFLRVPGAFLHAVDIAIDKAYTAASFGFATERWMSILESDPAVRAGIVQRPRLVVFGGGVPIYAGPQLVGGIGVSGGSAEQDAACARAGLAAIGLSDAP
ncbi:heme-binding protein [Methylibium sp.]|uniref:GlcG/HbpS family heme-binding protein n=1 Tax=Methylibium sp. TaxID=2067992 RepID=UPI00286B67C4|nr:heme-binding protein [Methylibium sp.]